MEGGCTFTLSVDVSDCVQPARVIEHKATDGSVLQCEYPAFTVDHCREITRRVVLMAGVKIERLQSFATTINVSGEAPAGIVLGELQQKLLCALHGGGGSEPVPVPSERIRRVIVETLTADGWDLSWVGDDGSWEGAKTFAGPRPANWLADSCEKVKAAAAALFDDTVVVVVGQETG